jgi:asparagine synthase (glutamine-hydrolysing)
MVHEHIDGRRDWSNRLWALMFLELWFREFID